MDQANITYTVMDKRNKEANQCRSQSNNLEHGATCTATPTLDTTSNNIEDNEVVIVHVFDDNNSAFRSKVRSHSYLASFEHIICDLESDGGRNASERVDLSHTQQLPRRFLVGAVIATCQGGKQRGAVKRVSVGKGGG